MCRIKILFVSLVTLFVISELTVMSADELFIRALVGGGYTAVNFPEASGYSDDYLEDWDQMNYSFSLQGLRQVAPKIRVGGEAGWERLYYWYYKIPYGYYPVYREADWSTMFVGPVVQFFLTPNVYVLGGADLHFFIDDGTALGLSVAFGTEYRLSNNLALPIEFRVKPVFGDGTPTVMQINIGIAWDAHQ